MIKILCSSGSSQSHFIVPQFDRISQYMNPGVIPHVSVERQQPGEIYSDPGCSISFVIHGFGYLTIYSRIKNVLPAVPLIDPQISYDEGGAESDTTIFFYDNHLGPLEQLFRQVKYVIAWETPARQEKRKLLSILPI